MDEVAEVANEAAQIWQAVPLSQETPAPTPGWEQKPVAMLVVEVTWPVISDGQRHPYEPWTVTSHWDQAMVVIVFGVPQTLEQASQRAVQATLAVRQLVTRQSLRGNPIQSCAWPFTRPGCW
jgi:hypothetical protein